VYDTNAATSTSRGAAKRARLCGERELGRSACGAASSS